MAVSNPGALDVTHDEVASLLEVARALEPLIREHAAALDDRRIPAPLVEALYDTGVFRSMLPREVGGLEVEPVEWLRMIEELARINGSVGWLAFINSGVGLTFLDPERFERFRLRGGGRLILAMNLGRMAGKAVRVDGGYRISGRWPFASGSPFATWLGGMSAVCDGAGSPVLDSSGQPQRLPLRP
jgi:alkylation response protein AidB-like acyl-CoA dehydrogenase